MTIYWHAWIDLLKFKCTIDFFRNKAKIQPKTLDITHHHQIPSKTDNDKKTTNGGNEEKTSYNSDNTPPASANFF